MDDRRPGRAPAVGRERLLDTAERLLDERGIDGCSARQITAAAGQRNATAVNYHFGNLDQLVRAVLRRHAEPLDADRHRRLDRLDARGVTEPRTVLRAMLAPLVVLLDDESGRRYLRLLNQAANHPAYYAEADLRYAGSLVRGAVHLVPLVAHLPPRRRPHRADMALGMVLYALAEQARLGDAEAPPRPPLGRRAFSEELVAAAIGALTA